jgi:hypothetical protein
MAHKGGLSPAFVAMMLRKNLQAAQTDSATAPSAASEHGFTPLEEILGSARVERPRVAVSDNLGRQGRASPTPIETPRAHAVAAAGFAPSSFGVGSRSAPQPYRSPSLDEILNDTPEEKRRPVASMAQADGSPANGKRLNSAQMTANSVTVPIPIYAVPPGYQSSGDGTNMYLRDRNGNLVKNPLLQKRIDEFRFNRCRIAADLGIVAGAGVGAFGGAGKAAGMIIGAGSNTAKDLCS